MSNLLICSVYYKDVSWFKIQRTFIEDNTKNYKIAVYLNDTPRDVFDDTIIVGESGAINQNCSENHIRGLNALYQFFLKSEYDKCLILDSDAFPIDNKWQSILDAKIIQYGKDYAAVVRTDNLDVFPHPCVVYFNKKVATSFKMLSSKGLIGNVNDASIDNNNYFPMIRTNKVNIHPLLCGIYYNLFYHHACGSRNLQYRSQAYYSGMPGFSERYNLKDKLMNNPKEFISNLKCNPVKLL